MSKNIPTNEKLWAEIQSLAKGERKKPVSRGDKTVNPVNEGKGFTTFPSAYANGWALSQYKRLGGKWKKEGSSNISFLQNELEAQYDGLTLTLSDLVKGNEYEPDIIRIHAIQFPKEKRKQGTGTQVMFELAVWADKNNKILSLTPSTDFGATSVSRLKKFYSKFGFKSNKGRNKDFRTMDAMIRYPKAKMKVASTPVVAGLINPPPELIQKLYEIAAGFFATKVLEIKKGSEKGVSQGDFDALGFFIEDISEYQDEESYSRRSSSFKYEDFENTMSGLSSLLSDLIAQDIEKKAFAYNIVRQIETMDKSWFRDLWVFDENRRKEELEDIYKDLVTISKSLVPAKPITIYREDLYEKRSKRFKEIQNKGKENRSDNSKTWTIDHKGYSFIDLTIYLKHKKQDTRGLYQFDRKQGRHLISILFYSEEMKNRSTFGANDLRLIHQFVKHELTHATQRQIGISRGISSDTGMPFKKRDTKYTQDKKEEEKRLKEEFRRKGLDPDLVNFHTLDDREFYTNLSDCVDTFIHRFSRRGKNPNQQIKDFIKSSPLFKTLKHFDKKKWNKAVGLFISEVNKKLKARKVARSYILSKRDDKGLKNVGKGGLDTWFSGHGGKKEERATWGDWVAITPIKHTVTKENGDKKTYESGDIVGVCAVSSSKEWASVTSGGKKPLKCMPREKAYKMPKKDRAELAKKKRREEAKHKGQKPVNTPTFSEKAKKILDKKNKKAHFKPLISPPPSEQILIAELGEVKKQYENRYNVPSLQPYLDEKPDFLFNLILKQYTGKSMLGTISDLMSQIAEVVIQHKEHFNLLRPNQLAELYNVPFKYDYLESAQTPSYPSGHTTQAYYLAFVFSDLIPEAEKDLMLLAKMISESRIDRGVHFLSDNKAGIELAKTLFKKLKGKKADFFREVTPPDSLSSFNTGTPTSKGNDNKEQSSSLPTGDSARNIGRPSPDSPNLKYRNLDKSEIGRTPANKEDLGYVHDSGSGSARVIPYDSGYTNNSSALRKASRPVRIDKKIAVRLAKEGISTLEGIAKKTTEDTLSKALERRTMNGTIYLGSFVDQGVSVNVNLKVKKTHEKGSYIYDPNRGTHIIEIYLKDQKIESMNHPFLFDHSIKPAMYKHLYSTLIHEMTHAIERIRYLSHEDEELLGFGDYGSRFDPNKIKNYQDKKKVLKRYYNNPKEVKAYLQQVADEVESYIVNKKGTITVDTIKESWKESFGYYGSKTWAKVSPYLTNKNQKYFKKAVLTYLLELVSK